MKIDEFRQRRKLTRAGAARAIRKVQKVNFLINFRDFSLTSNLLFEANPEVAMGRLRVDTLMQIGVTSMT